MRVYFSPVRSDDSLVYEFNGEAITVTLNGESEVFDFSEMPDGRLDSVETTLSVNPILSAERVNGVLSVQLLNFIGVNADQEDLFPEWKEV
ncbi:hypothetical protein [Neobacillus sp. 114]|uniref:hypothetical protein n=1 Tax=Neobacillus sp. 114 TaxID=3048535 RepID=UPI0024C2AA15|nr:hypothetical protein [Neobacillus sp. 114]